MRIIVALDIIGGKCVRLTRGDFSTKKVYSEDPLEIASMIEDSGLKYLHIVDLDGAKNKKPENLKIVERIAGKTSLRIDFGGGIRSVDDLKMAFSAGAEQVTAGSVAVTRPELFLSWLAEFGSQKIILGADHRNGKVSTGGWLEDTDRELKNFLSDYLSKGVRYTVCTDIERDGMLNGPSVELYKDILGTLDINLIASGGISSIGDIGKIRDSGCEGVIVGKAFYEGRITLKELEAQC